MLTWRRNRDYSNQVVRWGSGSAAGVNCMTVRDIDGRSAMVALNEMRE